jgi:hypothetical protein
MLSRTSQAAPTPKFSKVFCFFSSEKKTLLSYHTGLVKILGHLSEVPQARRG